MMHHSHMLLLASPWNSHTSVFSPEISRAHHGAENAVLGLEDLMMKARESLCLWFAAICIPAHHQRTDWQQCCWVVGFGDSGMSIDCCFEDCRCQFCHSPAHHFGWIEIDWWHQKWESSSDGKFIFWAQFRLIVSQRVFLFCVSLGLSSFVMGRGDRWKEVWCTSSRLWHNTLLQHKA